MSLFYIHKISSISAQNTFLASDLNTLQISAYNQLKAIEPKYQGIPLSTLRRMGKAVRLGVGSALPIIQSCNKIDGIILGTANGGMEDCIKFLNQIIEFDEGTLTPTNFVQSTTNAIASQIALLSSTKGYNVTHVHRGLAFENAAIDVTMLLREHPENSYLLGGVDEISTYNYNIEYLDGSYKKEEISSTHLYESTTQGSIAGEGSAMFLVNTLKENSLAELKALETIHSSNKEEIKTRLVIFLNTHLEKDEKVDVFISGENGDCRYKHFYEMSEDLVNAKNTLRFKHAFGEYPSISSMALWLAIEIIQNQKIPDTLCKQKGENNSVNTILIYNNYKGEQHSFMLINQP